MDCCKIPLVFFHHELHFALLHILWDDGCGNDTKSSHCFNSLLCFLCIVEFIFRIRSPETGTFHLQLCVFFFPYRCKIVKTWLLTCFVLLFFELTEDSSVVDMVLLDLPCGLDIIWISGFTIWRCERCA